MNYLRAVLTILFLSVVIVSCQKDQSVDLNPKVNLKSDTTINPGNLLAIKGTLNIIVGDSTYVFDAAKDSIAFINVNVDSNKYFGLTAINKAHTMSFGISSSGSPGADINKPVAGGQLLFSADNKRAMQYTLAKQDDTTTTSKINLLQYMQDSVLTKGTFYTIMAKGDKPNSPSYKVLGSFNLLFK